MKKENVKGLTQYERLELDDEIKTMMEDLKDVALDGLKNILISVDSMTLNRNFKGFDIEDIFLDGGTPMVTYKIGGNERDSKLEDFDPWIVVRIAIKCYNAWEAIVENGFLDEKDKKRIANTRYIIK